MNIYSIFTRDDLREDYRSTALQKCYVRSEKLYRCFLTRAFVDFILFISIFEGKLLIEKNYSAWKKSEILVIGQNYFCIVKML